MRIMNFFVTTLAAIASIALMGCNDEPNASSTPAATAAASEAVPADLFVTAAPADPVDIVAARKSAKPGEPITLRGRIGGRAEPFAPNRAVVTLTDMTLPTCAGMPGDACKTPWDSCCEPADQIAAKSATLQVAGADGKPLKLNLNGQSGLAPGKQIVVAGIVAPTTTDAALTVNAKQIYVTP